MVNEPDFKLVGLSLWVASREFADAPDVWHGNWLNVRARVEASGALVEASGPWLRTDDLEAFWPQLDAMHRDLRGEARLETLEPALQIDVRYGSLGRIEATISITPDHLSQKHEFKFGIDQSYLPDAARACKRILERFHPSAKGVAGVP